IGRADFFARMGRVPSHPHAPTLQLSPSQTPAWDGANRRLCRRASQLRQKPCANQRGKSPASVSSQAGAGDGGSASSLFRIVQAVLRVLPPRSPPNVPALPARDLWPHASITYIAVPTT